jgi:hypothetical protein
MPQMKKVEHLVGLLNFVLEVLFYDGIVITFEGLFLGGNFKFNTTRVA